MSINNRILKPVIDFFTVPPDREGAVCEIMLGLPRSGKSLYQVEECILPHLINNELVYTTQWLNWRLPNVHYFNDIDTVLGVRNAVFAFDEVAQVLPARMWSSETLEIQKFFQLHGHRHNDIYCNTQDVSLVAKTIGIVASKWGRVKKEEKGYLIRLIDKYRKSKSINFKYQELSYALIKKIASGELDDTPKESSEAPIDDNYSYSDDFYFGDIDIPSKLSDEWSNISYKLTDLYHDELNEYKAELVHFYCPECKSRQGQFIPIDDTFKYVREVGKNLYEPVYKYSCVKHRCPLVVRKSLMYDSYYEPEVVEKEVIFKPFYKAERWTNYAGSLSPKQLELKKQLELIKKL